MTPYLIEPLEIKEIILKDENFYARLECEITKNLLPKFTRVDLKLIESTFPYPDKSNFEREWSVKNAINNNEHYESYLTTNLQILLKTEIKPIFKEIATNKNKI